MLELIDKARTFPKSSGVYLMKNRDGKVLYVGKAINLRSRILNYFGKGRDRRYQIDALMKATTDIQYIVTRSEKEALLLEYNLIRENKPKYNIFFRDSKSYTKIRLTSYHDYPGIYVTRQTPKDGSTYFGPYTSSVACRETTQLIIRYFKIRNCSDHFFANRSRPCIQHEIGRCTAPCVGHVTQTEYADQIHAALLFLKGKTGDLVKQLKRQMKKASDNMNYEAAAHLRDVVHGIGSVVEPQAISSEKLSNKDYIGSYPKGDVLSFAVLELRAGKIVGYQSYDFKETLGDIDATWEQFLLQRYARPDTIPPEFVIDHEFTTLPSVMELLAERAKTRLQIKIPKRGLDKKRIVMAKTNAKEHYRQKYEAGGWPEIAEILKNKLKLPSILEEIECVDISNISGKHAVGSIVSFHLGRPNKDRYRIFNIRTKEDPDDYAMMYEALSRRFKGKEAIPDLLLVDGGKGQLMITQKVLGEYKIGVPIVAIAKGSDRKQDEIYLPGRKNPVTFKKGNRAHLFLQRIRDEAHRFGIEHYRKRHRKEATRSLLDDIQGVGPASRKKLLNAFGSVDLIKKKKAEEVSELAGVSLSLAKTIISFLTAKTR